MSYEETAKKQASQQINGTLADIQNSGQAQGVLGQIAGQGYANTAQVLRTLGDKLDNSIRQAENEVERLKDIKATTPAWLLAYSLDQFYRLKTI